MSTQLKITQQKYINMNFFGRFIGRISDQISLDYSYSRPSFKYKRMELERFRKNLNFIHATKLTKENVRALANELSIRTPNILARANAPEELLWEELPSQFVIKPEGGAASRGVFPIISEDGCLISLLDGKTSIEQISICIKNLAQKKPYHTESVLVEELILRQNTSGKLPFDWKFYSFQGEIGLIQQIERIGRNKTLFRYYDGDWKNLGRVRKGDKLNYHLKRPYFPEELITIAQKLSKMIRFPFVRIDLYEDYQGVLLGEITPFPGNLLPFRRDIDKCLGALWEDSEAKLLIQDRYADKITNQN
jgi:hypothetical protein